MTANYKKKNQPIPKALFYIQMIKYFILFGFGIPTAINFLLRVVGNELLQQHLVYCLCICDALIFFSTSGPALYLIFKSFPKLFKQSPVAKGTPDRSPDMDLPTLASYVKAAISLDMIFNSLCGLALSNMVGHIVGIVTGTNLYDLYEFNGKPYNPSKLLKILRLTIMICTTTTYALWAYKGVQSLENFVLYRLTTYTYFSFLLFFIIPTLYWHLLSKIIEVLENKYRRKKEKKPIGLYYLKLVKYACVFFFAYPSLVNCILILVGNTFYADSPKLMIFQASAMGCMTFFSTLMAFYPLFKSFQGLLAKTSRASVKESQTAVSPTVRMEPCTQ
ncbi:hypothetical protein HDV04_004607 [Boothiomyces sp. JEL0838]|nr:hypothetical protein HDV04_004607 [Boothiomyces sp. JEL0838]